MQFDRVVMTDNTEAIAFFDRCVSELKLSGKAEAAYFFDEVADHLKKGGLLNEGQDVIRILGL